VLAFATLMASELAETGFTAGGAPHEPPEAPGSG
jgi:hypothetical protein